MALLSFCAPALPVGAQSVSDSRLDPGYQSAPPALPPDAPDVDRAVTEVAPVSNGAAAIAGIRFKGADVPAGVAAATEAFLGRPADTATLQALAAAMSEAYRKSDVALFTLAIPAQDLSDGVVDVYIAEGHLTDVLTLENGEISGRLQLRGYLRPALEERPTSRASFERGISLLRRTDGLTVTPRLKTVPEPGGVAMLLDVTEKKNSLALGYDSRESSLVDSGRISVNAVGYGIVRKTDALRGRLASTPDGKQSRAANLQYKTPIGTNGLNLELAGAYQETRPALVDLRGDATFLSANLSYPVILDFSKEVSLSAAIDRIESTNSALGSVIANENISAARLGASAAWSGKSRAASAKLTYSRGLGLGSAESSVLGSDTEFDKFGLSTNLVQRIGKPVFLRLKGSVQWTDDILPANERLLVGGAEYGRGFDNGLISFDKGYTVSFEPAWRPLKDGQFARSELYLFADHGDGSVTFDGVNERSFDLSSAGVGTRLAYKDFAVLGLELAEPVNQPAPGLPDDTVFTLSWSFRYQPE
ncbi:MAG: ShlB/FhaC/HecB family hemolysin secretion/activation protein [Hyphomonas sp.]